MYNKLLVSAVFFLYVVLKFVSVYVQEFIGLISMSLYNYYFFVLFNKGGRMLLVWTLNFQNDLPNLDILTAVALRNLFLTLNNVTPRSHRLIKSRLFCIDILHLGSAHTVLASFWSSGLQKKDFYGEFLSSLCALCGLNFRWINFLKIFSSARQCSSRGGELHIHVRQDHRVEVVGKAVLVLQGSLYF